MLHSVANTLGHELWQSILTGGSLCVVDVLNFSRTSKSFWSVAQEDVIWHWLYCTEFATAEDVQPNRPWKAIYKSRAHEERLRLHRKRQAQILRLQNKAQISSANLHQAKVALIEQQTKLSGLRYEVQLLKQLRTTESATQCWTPSAVSKGFDRFLAQAPVEWFAAELLEAGTASADHLGHCAALQNAREDRGKKSLRPRPSCRKPQSPAGVIQQQKAHDSVLKNAQRSMKPFKLSSGLAFAAGLPSEECIAISRHKVAAARGSLEQSARMQLECMSPGSALLVAKQHSMFDKGRVSADPGRHRLG